MKRPPANAKCFLIISSERRRRKGRAKTGAALQAAPGTLANVREFAWNLVSAPQRAANDKFRPGSVSPGSLQRQPQLFAEPLQAHAVRVPPQPCWPQVLPCATQPQFGCAAVESSQREDGGYSGSEKNSSQTFSANSSLGGMVQKP